MAIASSSFKTFHRQIIPALSCARKETVDTGSFIIARIAKKIRQSMETVSRPPKRIRKKNINHKIIIRIILL